MRMFRFAGLQGEPCQRRADVQVRIRFKRTLQQCSPRRVTAIKFVYSCVEKFGSKLKEVYQEENFSGWL